MKSKFPAIIQTAVSFVKTGNTAAAAGWIGRKERIWISAC